MTNESYFGKKLKELRLDRGYTQSELSKICDISQAQVARYEKGDHMPTKRIINKIINGLGVDSEYFSNLTEVSNSSLDADYQRLRDSLINPEDKLVLRKILRGLYLNTQTKMVYNESEDSYS